MIKANEFVAKAKLAASCKTLYVKGCFGAPLNTNNKKRYTTNNSYNKAQASVINSASNDTFGFDCVCLIKGILWGWDANLNKVYGGANYCSNGVPDFGTENMLSYCTTSSTDFKNIEVGEVLYLKGHAGIYIGNGLAVEATAKWKGEVQITAVGNIGAKVGYNTRYWTKHGKLKFIDYNENKIVLDDTIYRVYDLKKKKWLPAVDINTKEYAGNIGNTISAMKINRLTYRVHDKIKNKWLPWVTGSDDYAGNLSNAIDGIQIKDCSYRVHTKGGRWLSWVSKVDDTNSGYAGIYGKEIDAIQIKKG